MNRLETECFCQDTQLFVKLTGTSKRHEWGWEGITRGGLAQKPKKFVHEGRTM